MRILNYSAMEIKYPVGVNMPQAMEMIRNSSRVIAPLVGNSHVNIWCRGSSGAILAALLCSALPNHTTICHIKKDGENSHSSNSFKFSTDFPAFNIMIDDFSNTGETLNAIWGIASKYVSVMNILLLDHIFGDQEMLQFLPELLIVNESSCYNKGYETPDFTDTGNNPENKLLIYEQPKTQPGGMAALYAAASSIF